MKTGDLLQANRTLTGFRVLIIGGTGQVGSAVVRALIAQPSCAEVVMVNRKTAPLPTGDRLRQVTLDTASAQFPGEVSRLAADVSALARISHPNRQKAVNYGITEFPHNS
jgi:nucleoside-diphosphate-sugar epimerase